MSSNLSVVRTWHALARDQGFTNGVFHWEHREGAYVAGPIKAIVPNPEGNGGLIVMAWLALLERYPNGIVQWRVGTEMARGYELTASPETILSGPGWVRLGPVTLYRDGSVHAPKIPAHVQGYPDPFQDLVRSCEHLGWSDTTTLEALRELFIRAREHNITFAIDASLKQWRKSLRGIDPATIEEARASLVNRGPVIVTPKGSMHFLGVTKSLVLQAVRRIRTEREEALRVGREPNPPFRSLVRAFPHPSLAEPILKVILEISSIDEPQDRPLRVTNDLEIVRIT